MIEFNIGDVIDDQFKVLEKIGRGGMGVVLRVQDLTEIKIVALKYCPSPDRLDQRRFGREVRIMAAIDHAHVMPVLYYNDEHDPPYFTMPIAGGSLADEVDSNMPTESALQIFKEVCLGVQAIHGSGATHRDLKPENVMRMNDGRIVISDLGLAKLDNRDSTTLTQTAMFLGTRVYCAPEQLMLGGSLTADARTDVFQLGKMLYELVTGDQPALVDPALIPPGLEYIIDRATEQHPDRRYQTVGQLMDAVENFLRARDPNASAHGEFEAALEQAKTLLRDNKYRSNNLERLLELVLQMGEDDDFYLGQFERFPLRLLRIMARRIPELLERPLRKYCDAVEAVIDSYNFEHAETVAKKMKTIFDVSENAALKSLAIKTTMIASVKLNRFAAMEVYDEMLQAVTTPEVAIPVAEMLRENLSYYRYLTGRVPDAKLHPAIRQIPKGD